MGKKHKTRMEVSCLILEAVMNDRNLLHQIAASANMTYPLCKLFVYCFTKMGYLNETTPGRYFITETGRRFKDELELDNAKYMFLAEI